MCSKASRGQAPQAHCRSAAELPRVKGLVGFNGALFIFGPGSDLQPVGSRDLSVLLNPRNYIPAANPDLSIRMLIGSQDGLTPQWHKDTVRQFASDMKARGHNSAAVTVAAVAHDIETRGAAWERTLQAILAVTGQ
jgi:hypothetical protein